MGVHKAVYALPYTVYSTVKPYRVCTFCFVDSATCCLLSRTRGCHARNQCADSPDLSPAFIYSLGPAHIGTKTMTKTLRSTSHLDYGATRTGLRCPSSLHRVMTLYVYTNPDTELACHPVRCSPRRAPLTHGDSSRAPLTHTHASKA